MEGRATAVLPVLASLCAFKAVPKALARHSAFPVPAGSGKGAENTALGVFLSATPISDHGMASLFPDVQRLTLQRLRATQSSVRSQLAAIQVSGMGKGATPHNGNSPLRSGELTAVPLSPRQDSVFTVLMSMLRAGGETRQAGLAWVQDCLAANAAREQTRPDPNTVASCVFRLVPRCSMPSPCPYPLPPHPSPQARAHAQPHGSPAARGRQVP